MGTFSRRARGDRKEKALTTEDTGDTEDAKSARATALRSDADGRRCRPSVARLRDYADSARSAGSANSALIVRG